MMFETAFMPLLRLAIARNREQQEQILTQNLCLVKKLTCIEGARDKAICKASFPLCMKCISISVEVLRSHQTLWSTGKTTKPLLSFASVDLKRYVCLWASVFVWGMA